MSAPLYFSLVNLGCPKNTVDSEGLLATMALAGHVFVEDPLEADVCVVNTCGFLEASRREAADILAELADARGRRQTPLLVAVGCLVERAGGSDGLDAFLRDADARVGFADYPRLADICTGLVQARPAKGYAGAVSLPPAYMGWLDQPRMRIGSEASAYLKIGEGCSNGCAYCAIPLIRGRRVSRPMSSILKEARELVASGVRELNVIAQDVTAYGMDRSGESSPRFADLLRGLLAMPEQVWFRILYAHPLHLTESILEVMASDPRVCPYLDLPLQHVNNAMLQRMSRGYDRRRVEEVMGWIRRTIPDMALRTTFIVGHPGEGEAEFEELLAFVNEGHFDHMGAFVWSPEPGTASVEMPGRVDPAVAESRCARLMEAQSCLSASRLRSRCGREVQMLLEWKDRKGWHGRTIWQAPEVDGQTLLSGRFPGRQVGDFVRVRITGATHYDCRAEGV
ncbi:MAG: 30S ribosomal protein S12 methylthiotransferase RimO [Verrucomicrobiota bacterium]|jgi:ribosomal protein S12 methylthiotransferase|nr:30S ribosomal protein S12 methylthiotransferase RimO [Verrucomicrobiota bacterium]